MFFDKIIIKNLEFFCYHGVHEEERKIGQKFLIDIELFLDFKSSSKSDSIKETISYSKVIKFVKEIMLRKKYKLIESIAENLAENILEEFFSVKKTKIIVKKPNAPINLSFEYVAVEIIREQKQKEAILALGSNMGNAQENVKNAIRELKKKAAIKIKKISNFYKTKPHKVPNPEEQNDYINCCVKISTQFSPNVLLNCCLEIEKKLGRVRTFKFASRIIDIDLICYESCKKETEFLTLPHPHARKRLFVLLPLRDLYPISIPSFFSMQDIDWSSINQNNTIKKINLEK
ncbi:MAG: 2-amino-4-hydroxy-6-hydroxymethyldihydropteridine diphosphokinase [Oscillospiraceae bacterium]|jgi:dihydroneopterin aldolase/2-amino-4-hydroxy-6-hydroxymethyldihydropteridine diphosphokinase|nr:2-amino-4-hydroxy-6-hydroxymethyldihydropteridine diphosphokinase [Oscillospiraceae bacterium]